MINRLRAVMDILLDGERPASSLRPELLELVEILEGLAPRELDVKGDESLAGGSETENGVALSPERAALCASDYVRSIVFLRGVRQAIEESLRQRQGEVVRVLYAGCGPFGLLGVPLLGLFRSTELQMSFLDIHQESIESVRAILEGLECEDRVSELIVGDILDYQSGEFRPQIVLTETMQAGLEREPQVAISRHLMRLFPDALLIPEEIGLEVKLVDVDLMFRDEEKGGAVNLGEAFTLSQKTISTWSANAEFLPGGLVDVPGQWDSSSELMLGTRIRVYGDHVLGDQDSGLTCLRALARIGEFEKGERLRFSYRLGENPGVEFRKE